jgi:signal transduction histidine kinase
VRIRAAATAGILAVFVTACSTAWAGAAGGGFWLRSLFVACWLTAAVVVAWRGEDDVAGLVTVVFLISFPVAFSGLSAGGQLLDQTWRALGSVSVVAFLYLFPRGAFEPRWSAVSCAVSAGYLTVRAFFPQLAGWTGDLIIFPLIVLVPLALQVLRFRSASNPLDRRRLKVVGLTSGAALVGQLVLFGLIAGLWQGPPDAAEPVVEPLSYGLALLMPAGVTLAMVPVGGPARRILERLTASADGTAELIARMGAVAQSSTSARELVPFASEAIRRSLRVPAVVIELIDSAESAGGPPTDIHRQSWPLTYRGRAIGRLHVTPRPGNLLSSGDRHILDQLSLQLAPMVGAVHLADQLEIARTHLLNLREEERRRLRADLHDELGATLASLTLKTGLAGDLIDRDPGGTRRLLREIEANLQTSVNRIRELVEGLRPSQLDELGLDAAIREQAERLITAGSPMAFRVYGHAQPGLPAAVELAAYRIAQEALTNAVRHSGGSRVDIELTVGEPDGVLTLRVTDDGTGLSQSDSPGFGMQSMRQRARDVGGECLVGATPSGGVVVTALLPLPPVGAS